VAGVVLHKRTQRGERLAVDEQVQQVAVQEGARHQAVPLAFRDERVDLRQAWRVT